MHFCEAYSRGQAYRDKLTAEMDGEPSGDYTIVRRVDDLLINLSAGKKIFPKLSNIWSYLNIIGLTSILVLHANSAAMRGQWL